MLNINEVIHMRKVFTIILCIIMVLSLTACGGSDGENSSVKSEGTVGADEKVSADSEATGKTEATGDSKVASDQSAKAGSPEITALENKYRGLAEDELKWEYNSAAKTIVISGDGPMKDYLENEPEWYQYFDQAVKVVIGDGVTSVGAGAFFNFTAIEEVELGEKVEFIGDSAFYYCTCLRTVNFPAGLKYIDKYAFYNDLLHSSNGFTFPEGMLHLGENSFHSAFKENTVSIPASLTSIEKGAFSNVFVTAFNVDPENSEFTSVDGILYDKNITTLINYPADKQETLFEIPQTVSSILKDAIEVTNTLEKIVIPASVTLIEEEAIFWNYALRNIEVDAANNAYKSEDGVLFSKDGKLLLSYPAASDRTEYTIPEGTERICVYAVSQANNLTEIHCAEGLKEISDYGMYNCQNLISIGLPASIETIGSEAFTFCDALSEINYTGNSSGWQNVKIGEGNDRLIDGSIEIHCVE